MASAFTNGTNVTVFVDCLHAFEFRHGVVRWLSEENRSTERRCMALAGFRETYARMGEFLAKLDAAGAEKIVPFPTKED